MSLSRSSRRPLRTPAHVSERRLVQALRRPSRLDLVSRDLLDGARLRPYRWLALLRVLVERPRRSLAFLVRPAVSPAAEDPRHLDSPVRREVSLLLASLVERPASLLASRPAGRLLDLTPRDVDEADDFWSISTIPPTNNLQTAGIAL